MIVDTASASRRATGRTARALLPWLVLVVAWTALVVLWEGDVSHLLTSVLVSITALASVIVHRGINWWVLVICGFMAWPTVILLLLASSRYSTDLHQMLGLFSWWSLRNAMVSGATAAVAILLFSRGPRREQFDPRGALTFARNAVGLLGGAALVGTILRWLWRIIQPRT